MVKEDSILAQKIVGLSHSNCKNTMFHNESAIYIKSNELITEYEKYLQNKKDVLSVIASADQIITMILGGSKNIDSFDISTFPKYYMYLKLAGIMSLNVEDYLNFFYKIDDKPEVYDDLYFDLIRNNLEKEAKEFWDSLINFYDWNDITSSTLFSSEPVSVSSVLNQTSFINTESFSKLKELIPNININTYEGNILDIADNFNKKYDLIYLSNIIYYVDRKEYKELLEKLKLTDNGIALTYLYNSLTQINNYFNENNYNVEEINNTKAGLLIKRK